MAMTTYQGYIDNQGRFISLDTATIPKHRKAVIVMSDELINKSDEPKLSKSERQLMAIDRYVNEDDEPMPEGFEEFIKSNRVNTTRKLDL